MRKFVIGLVSLGAVIGLYLLYNHLSKAPPMVADRAGKIIDTVIDANAGIGDGEIGTLGEVGVGRAEDARFKNVNPKTKKLEQEFGFKALLHKRGDEWETEKPFMNFYQRTFDCYITADKGIVRVETVGSRHSPKDAVFSGNVDIHILPRGPNQFKQCHIYLDDITFLSDKSQFSTAGPLRFVSSNTKMFGTGMELVYNNRTESLEFFKIIDLESLRIKAPKGALFAAEEKAPASTKKPASAKSDTPVQVLTVQPDKAVVSDDSQKAGISSPNDLEPAERKESEHYKCVFRKNVVIDTPEQLLFADKKLFISDIFWSKDSSETPVPADSNFLDTRDANDVINNNAAVKEPNEPNEVSEELIDIVITCDNGLIVAPEGSPRAAVDFAKTDNETTDRGTGFQPVETRPGWPCHRMLDNAAGRTTFLTQTIDYNAPSGDIAAAGPSELTIYVEDSNTAEPNTSPVPVKVTAQRQVRFFKASNEVIFDGDCLLTMPRTSSSSEPNYTLTSPTLTVNLPKEKSGRSFALPDILAAGPAVLKFTVEEISAKKTTKKAPIKPLPDKKTTKKAPRKPLPVKITAQKQASFLSSTNQAVFEGACRTEMIRKDPNFIEEYSLLSEKLTVDLPKDTNDRSSASAGRLERLTAEGGVVRLASVKKVEGKVVSGIELECRKFVHDPNHDLFTAAGPGKITFNNSTAKVHDPNDPNEQSGSFSLKKPCWAIVENYDTLKYLTRANRIVADADSQGSLTIHYFPMKDGKFTKHIVATANHMEADLVQTARGETELSTLKAIGGITYRDDDNHFIGSELFYDHAKSLMKVHGGGLQPCYFNGALVEDIEYNLKTGKIKAKVIGPGPLQLK